MMVFIFKVWLQFLTGRGEPWLFWIATLVHAVSLRLVGSVEKLVNWSILSNTLTCVEFLNIL